MPTNKERLNTNNETISGLITKMGTLKTEKEAVKAAVDKEKLTTLIPENIKSGVDIFGVIGSLSIDVAELSYSADTYSGEKTITLNHSLGRKPVYIICISTTTSTASGILQYLIYNDTTNTAKGYSKLEGSNITFDISMTSSSATITISSSTTFQGPYLIYIV